MRLYSGTMIDKQAGLLALAVYGVITAGSHVHAQELEPRAYVNTPVGLNFLLAGYTRFEGALLFDPQLPIKDVNAKIDMAFIGYVRTLGIAGKSTKIGSLLPYARLDADGFVDGQFVTREDNGLADPIFYFTINLFGAPALSFEEFRHFQQETIIGLTFKLTAPLGEYDNTRLLNLGTNRWSFKSEIGLSQSLGRWTLEAATAVTLFSDNEDFLNGQTRQQDEIYSVQGHAVYAYPSDIWLSIGATYYSGGRTTTAGVVNDNLQQNWRAGFTLALPIDRHHSIKILVNNGVSTRTGNDYDSLGIAWQYRWGGGL